MKPYSSIKFDDITRTELQILSRLDWNLFKVLPIDFSELFVQVSVIFDDDRIYEEALQKIKENSAIGRRPKKNRISPKIQNTNTVSLARLTG